MEQDLPVSPGADTEIPAPEPDDQTPEAVEPETNEPEPTPEPEPDEKARAVKRLERRIDRVTAARYEAEARAKQAEERAAQLEAHFRQMQGDEPTQQPQVDPVALADQIATIRETTNRANTVAADGKARFQGFSKALQTVASEAGQLFTPHGLPTALGQAILAADDPAALLHHVGSDPDLAADLHGLSPIQVARKLARIELEMSRKPEPKHSTTPVPLTPVKTTSSAQKEPSEMSYAEFVAWRRKHLGRT